MTQQVDSLKKRYIYRLASRFFGLLMGLITQGMVPRGLGPIGYGIFSYIENFFSQIMSFLDMGTSTAFYSKLSRRPREFGIISFYFRLIGALFCIIALLVFILHLTGTYPRFFPGIGLAFIYLGLLWAIINFLSEVLTKMMDAFGLTVAVERTRMMLKVIATLIIVALFFSRTLNLNTYFLYQYFLFLFPIVVFALVLEQRGHSLFRQPWALTAQRTGRYTQEFFSYSFPLLVYALFSMVLNIFDRWLLQNFSGSIEQGFYGLAYNIGQVCFIFTSSLTPLLMREFSIAHHQNDQGEMRRLFERTVPSLYSLAAYFACFVAVQAKAVIYIFGGQAFTGAILPLMIMVFYPVHQTYGQLSGSVFYATGQTKLYRNIGIPMLFIGLFISYFLLAPHSIGGLGLGSLGLALKMILIQVIGVNIMVFFNCRALKLSYRKYVLHQIGVIAILLLLSTGTYQLLHLFITNILLSFLYSGVFYSLATLLIMVIYPQLFGIQRTDLDWIVNKAKQFIKIIEWGRR